MFSTLQGIVIAVLILVAVVVMALIATDNTRRRREKLRRRFGPEYDRAVQEFGNVGKAEKELAARARRLERLHLHELNQADRIHFGNAWSACQAKFVDSPSEAVSEANQLIKTVMQARGYPVEDFEHRVADLSVEHANVVQHYRADGSLDDAFGLKGTAYVPGLVAVGTLRAIVEHADRANPAIGHVGDAEGARAPVVREVGK